MNRPGEAIVHFQRAAELQIQTPIEALLSLWEMASCKILTREFRDSSAFLPESNDSFWYWVSDEVLWWSEQWCDVWLVGDYDGALAVLSEMQHMCQERGLQLPGTNTPVGMNIINFHKTIQSILVLKSRRVRCAGLNSGIFTRFCCLFGFPDQNLQSLAVYKQKSCYVLWLIFILVKYLFCIRRVSSLLVWTSANKEMKHMLQDSLDSCFSSVCFHFRCIYGYHSKVWNLQGITSYAAWGKLYI